MKVEMLMPQMGESIAEATILKWLKSVGDAVKKDETILEISTDKVDSEIPSPESGILAEVVAQEGDTVEVKSVIAYIETDASAEIKPQASSPAPQASAPEVIESDGAEMTQPTTVTPQASPVQASTVQVSSEGRFYSPLVRSIASQHGLSQAELDGIGGTGESGRVTKKDILAYIESKGSTASAPAPAPAVPKASPASSAPAAPRPAYNESGVQVVPMDRMRKAIADHMVRSKHTSPHVYSVAEVDVTNIAKCRELNKKEFKKREGFNLSFTPFFLEATVKALVQYPGVNSSVDGDNIILKKDVNLGCAVALGTTGLIVPVIKCADQLNLVGIARALTDLAGRARDKKLKPDETQGGTFTVTNPGIFGNIIGCPIINQPQAAILAVCAIKKRPVVVDDAIAIRSICYLTLSYDHRIIDGSLSGHFLSYLTNYLESWDPNMKLI